MENPLEPLLVSGACSGEQGIQIDSKYPLVYFSLCETSPSWQIVALQSTRYLTESYFPGINVG